MALLKKHHRFSIFSILVFVNFLIWNALFTASHKGILTVAFLNVGQGDAIFIEAPNGNQMIIDGGPDRKILSELSKIMPFYDRSLDMIVVTNPDKDHFAGFLSVLDLYSVDSVLEPGTFSDTSVYAELEKKIQEKNIPKILARRGMKIILDDTPGKEVAFFVLFPDRDISNWTANDGSLIAKLVYGDTSVIFQGDATAKTEKYLVELEKEGSEIAGGLRADILKVGHHGSRTSTASEYVNAVSPEYAVISLGKNNKYDHPHKETLETLKNAQVKILRTDELGTIILRSDGNEVTFVN